jgi:hypothetical protein
MVSPPPVYFSVGRGHGMTASAGDIATMLKPFENRSCHERVEQVRSRTVGSLMDRVFLAVVFVGIILLVGALALTPP